MESCPLGTPPPSWESICSVAVAYAMAPVWGAGFCSLKGGVEGVTNLRRVQRVLVAHASAAGGLSCTEYVLIAFYTITRQRCWR